MTRERITYRFHLPDGVETVTLLFDSASFTLCPDTGKPPPPWTRLDFHRCGHCPLPHTTPTCPFAAAFSGFVEDFDRFYSYEEALIKVETQSRTIVARKPLQHAVASLIGLIGATSGCPHLAFYRPMARFHLPFARDDETLYRVFSMYLLSRFLENGTVDLADLTTHAAAACRVNHGMAERLRAAFRKDVMVNAIITLDSFAQAVPLVIEDRLNELRALFGLPDL